MQDPLVAAASESKGNVFQGFYKFTIYKNIYTGKHFFCKWGIDFTSRDQIHIVEITGVAPDGFVRIGLADIFQKTCKNLLVLRLERLTAKKREAFYIRRLHKLYDGSVCCFCKGLSIIKVPGFGIEAAFTMMTAAGNKQAYTNAGAIGNVIWLNSTIMHDIISFGTDSQFYR